MKWLIKSSHVQKLQVAEMRILRWMYEYIKEDRIMNESIQDKEGVTS